MRTFFREFLKDFIIVISIVALVAICVSIFLVHVQNEFEISQRGYELAKVTRNHRRLIEENRRLKVESAMLMRTDRVIERAKLEFNLKIARPDQVILIDEQESTPSIKTAMK